MPTDTEPHPAAPSIRPRILALEGNPVLATAGLLLLFMLAHAIVLWLLDMLIDWTPSPPWDEVAESLGVALLCTPLMLVLIRRFERRTRLALQALDITSDGFLILDSQGRLIEVNDGYAQLSGYANGELLQFAIGQLELPAQPATRRMSIATARSLGHYRYEGQHRRKDGRLVDVDVTVVWLAELDCVAAFVRERGYRGSDMPVNPLAGRTMQQLFELSTAGLCALDAQGRCTFINPAALKMLDREHDAELLLGAPAHDLFHAQTHRTVSLAPKPCPLCDAQRSGQALHLQGPALRRFDGSGLHVSYWSQPVVQDGQVCGSVVTFIELPEHGT